MNIKHQVLIYLTLIKWKPPGSCLANLLMVFSKCKKNSIDKWRHECFSSKLKQLISQPSLVFLCFCTIKFCYCYFKNVKEMSTILSHVPNMAFQHVSHWWRRRNTCVWVDYNVYYLTVQQPASEHELDDNQLVRAPADFVIILSC